MELKEVKDFEKDFKELLAKYRLKASSNFTISYDFGDDTYLMYLIAENISDDV